MLCYTNDAELLLKLGQTLAKCCRAEHNRRNSWDKLGRLLNFGPSLVVGAMSTSQRAVMSCDCRVKAGMVCVLVAGKTV